MNTRRLPFQNMTPDRRRNLALVAILAFYVIVVGFDIISHNMCGNIAMDYCAYWSIGKIIHSNGYADIYNLDLVTKIQNTIYPQAKDPSIPFQIVPFPYPPVFAFPFQILSFLPLENSFWIWTFLNLIGFILYLRFFTKEVTGHPLPTRLVFMFMLSLPVFLNLFWGQVNIWLGICAGEFMRAILSNKPYRAGLWLGGWWLKPQLFVLIIPILLFQRSIKVLAGFASTSFLVAVASFALIGQKGLIELVHLLLGSAQGTSASNPEIMMNWRMLALHLSYYVSPLFGWAIAILGSILTLVAVFYLFRKPVPANSQEYGIVLLGILAATGAVTWHAHLSMAIVLIPPMIYLYLQKRFPIKLISWWVLMPVFVMMVVYILAALIQVKILPTSLYSFLNLLAGLRGLILNLLFLAWAIVELRKQEANVSSFSSVSG